MSRTYTIAGVSTSDGVTKYRFANGDLKARAKVLERAEHTNIDLRELASPMDKAAAIAWLETQGITAARPKSGIAANTKTMTPEEVVAVATAEATAEAGAAAAQEQLNEEDTAALIEMANS
jgi:hypothetical protein